MFAEPEELEIIENNRLRSELSAESEEIIIKQKRKLTESREQSPTAQVSADF